jgi:hypothetical protein
MLFRLEAQVGEAPAQQFQPHPAIALVCRRQHHNELLTAQAADDIGLAAMGAQQVGQRAQYRIANDVAEAVIDAFEVVQINQGKVSGRCSRSARLISRPRVSSR